MIILLQTFFSIRLTAQPDCGVDLTDGILEAHINELPAIDQFLAQRGPVSLQDVPVRLTIFHGPGSQINFSQADFNAALGNLNSAFLAAGLNFVPCGPIHEIYDNRIKTGAGSNPNYVEDQFLTSFSYTSGAIEVYLRNTGGPNTAVIPLPAYHEVNPNWAPEYTEYSNWVNMKTSGISNSSFVHEVGHHYGLFHTHGANKVYNVPDPDENTQDYPYKVFIPNSNQLQPWWWGRELVIRADVAPGTKTFYFKNWNEAGDLLEDTPADCAVDLSNIAPGCTSAAQNFQTCQIIPAQLTYTDYNGDAIYPPPAPYLLGRNFMSYWMNHCRNQFTTGQNGRIGYYYETYRKPTYFLNKCGNFTDKVEFEGSSIGLHNVTIRVRHPLDDRKCNVTTNQGGEFDGMLFTDILKPYVYHNGKKGTLAYPNDPLRIHYEHTSCEWRRGVSSIDLSDIKKHVLGIQPLNGGFSKLAADANKDNLIGASDIIELRKLILGIYDKLPAYDQPWRYVPEFITQDYATDFNFNPFNLSIGGGNAYFGQGWQFTLIDAQNGKKGFDGIKIGDVDSSWPNDAECPDEMVAPTDEGIKPVFNVPATSLAQNQTVSLVFRVNDFQQVEAFQLGIGLPYEYFEVQDVTDITLPSYNKVDHFGLTKLEENVVRTLWFEETGGSQTLPANSRLFSLIIKAKQPVANLQSVLKLDNSILPNKFWRNSAVTAEPVSLTVMVEGVEERSNNQSWRKLPQNSESSLLCYPNPFEDNIRLSFVHHGPDMQGDLSIADIRGVEIYCRTLPVSAGENTFEINALKGIPVGIYWVVLNTNRVYTTILVKE